MKTNLLVMRNFRVTTVVLSLLSLPGLAQVSTEGEVVTETPAFEIPAEPTKGKKEKQPKVKYPKQGVPFRFMANIHASGGIMSFLGDVRDLDNTTVHRMGNRFGFQGGIGGSVSNWLDLNLDVMYARLNGNENEHGLHRNFEATKLGLGVNAVYNFRNFIRDPKNITPYITAGVGYAEYKVATDSIGVWNNRPVRYHYWANGGLYAYPETSPQPQDGTPVGPIDRDYVYETAMYTDPVRTVVFPIGAGLDLNISRKMALRVGFTYFFTLTDKIDGRNDPVTDGASNDGYFFTSMAVIYKFDPFKKRVRKEDIPDEYFYDFTNIESADADEDGVPDFMDDCSGTPKGIKVSPRGCPADTDKDGIPDYRDKQNDTPPGSVVDADGVAISYQKIEENYKDTASLLRKDVTQEWLFGDRSKDASYTVHVGTFNKYDVSTQIKMKLDQMLGLVERKVNDSVSVFTLGQFDSFEDAVNKQNELRESGLEGVYGVADDKVVKTGTELKAINPRDVRYNQRKPAIEAIPDVLAYGVELREYRLRIELDKLSKLIAQYGVQMTSTGGGMKVYTIGAFKTYKEAVALQKEVEQLGVKNPSITARFNGTQIDLEKAREMEGQMK